MFGLIVAIITIVAQLVLVTFYNKYLFSVMRKMGTVGGMCFYLFLLAGATAGWYHIFTHFGG